MDIFTSASLKFLCLSCALEGQVSVHVVCICLCCICLLTCMHVCKYVCVYGHLCLHLEAQG